MLRIIELLFEDIDEMEILEKIVNHGKAYELLN
jgi:hypothetical protein